VSVAVLISQLSPSTSSVQSRLMRSTGACVGSSRSSCGHSLRCGGLGRPEPRCLPRFVAFPCQKHLFPGIHPVRRMAAPSGVLQKHVSKPTRHYARGTRPGAMRGRGQEKSLRAGGWTPISGSVRIREPAKGLPECGGQESGGGAVSKFSFIPYNHTISEGYGS
jgi:hypothetical protein